MEKSVLLLVIALCGANAISFDTSASSRLVSSQEASITNFPYVISMQKVTQLAQQTRGHVCGGALISLQHVLTAATCAFEFNMQSSSYGPINITEYRIFTGATMLTNDTDPSLIRTIVNFTVHPEYIHPPASLNNIGVITLNAPFPNTLVTPLALPVTNFIPADFALCQIASWGAQALGQIASTSLRFTNKYVYNQNLCTSLFSTMIQSPNIFPSMICAASFDILSSGCEGDLGTPLVCDGGLTGIMFQSNMCIFSSFPEVYTRVSNYTQWIQDVSGISGAPRIELSFFGILALVIARFLM